VERNSQASQQQICQASKINTKKEPAYEEEEKQEKS